MEQKKYLVCIDSDGCAIDSMNSKHIQCFGPALVSVWHLEECQKQVLKRWNEINLFSATRGINRFKGLALMLQETKTDDLAKQIREFAEWTMHAPELSNDALQAMCTGSAAQNPVFTKALKWSLSVNTRIKALPISAPFPSVPACLEEISRFADIAVVSSANREAIMEEWRQGGLASYVCRFFFQSDGSKSQCISDMIRMGYSPDHILMVGDAPGDYAAAAENLVWFYPILAGKEDNSWKTLKDGYLRQFLHNEFQKQLQQDLVNMMKENLQT